jgi:hypothetical protein
MFQHARLSHLVICDLHITQLHPWVQSVQSALIAWGTEKSLGSEKTASRSKGESKSAPKAKHTTPFLFPTRRKLSTKKVKFVPEPWRFEPVAPPVLYNYNECREPETNMVRGRGCAVTRYRKRNQKITTVLSSHLGRSLPAMNHLRQRRREMPAHDGSKR